MAEDFLTYIETDPNSKITVTSEKVTWALLNRVEAAYVYKDKGVDYFNGDFQHLLTFKATGGAGGGGSNGIAGAWTLANAIDTRSAIDTASGSYLGLVALVTPASAHAIYIEECDSGTIYASSQYTVTINTAYYLKIIRDEAVGTYGTFYCYVYSDAARTTLLTTLSVTLHTSKKDFRYIYAAHAQSDAVASTTHSGYTESLEESNTGLLPEVTQQSLTSIAATTATGNGYIVRVGNSSVTEHGHCWNTAINPTTANSKTTNGAGAVGTFTSAITGLTPGTTYYVRAYATNSYGTVYSLGISFISGDATSITIKGNLKVVGTNLIYVGSDGKSYTLTKT